MDFNGTTPYDTLVEKWSPLIDAEGMPSITDVYRRRNTAVLLENQRRANVEMLQEAAPTSNMGGGFSVAAAASPTGNLAGYDPILISLVRRAMPNVVAYDIASVQPMSAPTGLIFAFRSRYENQTGLEAMYDEPIASYAGASGSTGINNLTEGSTYTNPFALGNSSGNWSTGITTGSRRNLFARFRGFLTGDAEKLGGTDTVNDPKFREMSFSIERVAVSARSRALKAEYTTELAQDLKAVHGLDAEAELANILSVEILNEINREILRAAYTIAKTGSQQTDLSATGSYNMVVDSDGRWSAERYRGLMYQIEREANVIAKETRRGKGNFVLCSSDVASALAMGGFLNLTPAVQNNLSVDDTGNVFAGVLNGRYKVYIDPFVPAGVDFFMVGYKGTSPYDAGMYYCPYVPLQMVRDVGQDSFQPKIGFKTRYGLVANPYAQGRTSFAGQQDDGLAIDSNVYYRLTRVINLHGVQAGGTA